jgi:FeS assembly SUF system protein
MTDMMEEGKIFMETAPWDAPQEPPAHKDLPEPCAHTVEVAKDFTGESAIPEEELERMTQGIIAALKTVYDPEIPVDIYELGLIYRIDITDERTVDVEMTLTAPGCPVAGEMPAWVENAVGAVEGVGLVKVEIVFNPPWDPSRMSDEARVALNMF